MSTTSNTPRPSLDELHAAVASTWDGGAKFYTILGGRHHVTGWTGSIERDGRSVRGWWWAVHNLREVLAISWSPGTHRANRDSDVARAVAQIAAGRPAQGLAS
ncbi:MAG: hypothetical protein ABR520_11395 [Mycobacteriales bacterium]|nr:hypothetical protein [Actinomycetota bacterium]